MLVKEDCPHRAFKSIFVMAWGREGILFPHPKHHPTTQAEEAEMGPYQPDMLLTTEKS